MLYKMCIICQNVYDINTTHLINIPPLANLQRKCSKFLQKRREEILRVLEPFLPREVVLYVVLEY